jgi:hypothetical protein
MVAVSLVLLIVPELTSTVPVDAIDVVELRAP